MKKILFIILISITNLYAQDFGDASDGTCNFSGLQAKATWNCTDIAVTGNTTFPGTSAVVLKATGSVTINNGFTLSVAANAVTAGPGGSNGGNCTASCDQINGSGTGAGNGGAIGDDAGFNGGSGGGGGAGGTYNGNFPGNNGFTGITAGGSTAGVLGTAQSSGYGSEASLDVSALGGSGGGSGGSGDQGGGSYAGTEGGDGGGGGGAISIFVQGAVSVEGSISANGAAGSDGDNTAEGTGAGGGGGSGGAVYIYSKELVTINGSITATGGAAGSGGDGGNTNKGGNGGAGGKGRIRIDSLSGSFSGTGSVDPSPYQVSTAISNNYPSEIEFGCVYKGIDTENSFILTFLLSFILVLLIAQFIFKES